jgi:hypothetical protein
MQLHATTPITGAMPLCWICRENPANSGEHRIKASDVRAVAPDLSQANPVFGQERPGPGHLTNVPIGSAKSHNLQFKDSICRPRNSTRTQPYDDAWKELASYLRSHWPRIARAGRFDLSSVFPGGKSGHGTGHLNDGSEWNFIFGPAAEGF